MTCVDILFETDRFNVSEVTKHFINPCCFGEDLAQWLRQKLIAKDVTAGTPGQEDWGWYLFVQRGSDRYFLSLGGHRKENSPAGNEGEWRIIVEKRRSLWDRLRGRDKITESDALLLMIEDILREAGNVRNVRRESS
jgi:hypothetical protein